MNETSSSSLLLHYWPLLLHYLNMLRSGPRNTKHPNCWRLTSTSGRDRFEEIQRQPKRRFCGPNEKRRTLRTHPHWKCKLTRQGQAVHPSIRPSVHPSNIRCGLTAGSRFLGAPRGSVSATVWLRWVPSLPPKNSQSVLGPPEKLPNAGAPPPFLHERCAPRRYALRPRAVLLVPVRLKTNPPENQKELVHWSPWFFCVVVC